MSSRKSDPVVIEFIENRHGVIVMLTNDALVVRSMRNMVLKVLGIKRDCVHSFSQAQAALREIKKCVEHKSPVVVLLERIIEGRPTTNFLHTVKSTFEDLKVVVLTGETTKENLVFLYELGADSVIVKPASTDNLVEKIANTLKPAGKLGPLIQEGKDLLAKGEFEKVLALSDEVLEIKPGSPAGLMLKGDALNGMGRSKEAVKAFMEAHKSSSLFLEPIKKLAEIYRDRDQDSYLKYLLKLDSLSPLNSERKCEIGKVYVKKSEMSEAEAYFDQAISCATKEALGYVSNVVETIADVLAEVSLEMSQKYLSQVLELKKDNLGPMDLSVFNRLGINLRQQGKWREAVDNYKKALTIAPDDPGLFYNLAMAYLDGKGLKKASASLDKALSINPEFWKTSDSVCYNIAYIYYSVKDFSSARHHLKNTLELNPGNQKAKKLLDRIKGR